MRAIRLLAATVVLLGAGCSGESSDPDLDPTSVDRPADAPETEAVMPDVVCMNLQAAQDRIQEGGVFYSRSEDATGEGRNQVIDSNWIVVAQDPAAGASIGEGDAVLSVVKTDEPNDC